MQVPAAQVDRRTRAKGAGGSVPARTDERDGMTERQKSIDLLAKHGIEVNDAVDVNARVEGDGLIIDYTVRAPTDGSRHVWMFRQKD